MAKQSGGGRRTQSQAEQETAEYAYPRGPGDEGGHTHEHPVITEALAQLAEHLAQVATYNVIGDALKDGFDNLAAQLVPLRDLGPRALPDLGQNLVEAIEQVQIASARPSWDTGGAMPALDVEPVIHIGQARPAANSFRSEDSR